MRDGVLLTLGVVAAVAAVGAHRRGSAWKSDVVIDRTTTTRHKLSTTTDELGIDVRDDEVDNEDDAYGRLIEGVDAVLNTTDWSEFAWELDDQEDEFDINIEDLRKSHDRRSIRGPR